MRLTPPKMYTWVLALVLLVLGLLGHLDVIEALKGNVAFYFETGGLALMLVAAAMKGI